MICRNFLQAFGFRYWKCRNLQDWCGWMENHQPGERRFEVRNRTRGTLLGDRVRLADTPRSRGIGLLRENGLEPGAGLWIFPCEAIHTFWMRFSIDVAFLDRDLRVKRVYHRMPPFRLSRF